MLDAGQLLEVLDDSIALPWVSNRDERLRLVAIGFLIADDEWQCLPVQDHSRLGHDAARIHPVVPGHRRATRRNLLPLDAEEVQPGRSLGAGDDVRPARRPVIPTAAGKIPLPRPPKTSHHPTRSARLPTHSATF